MAFLAVEGFGRTSSLKKYLLRLFLFGLIAQVPYMLALGAAWFQLNILFTIFWGMLLLVLHEKIKSRALFWTVFVIGTLISATMDWQIIGIVVMILYLVISNERARRIVPAIVVGAYMVGAALLVFVIVGEMDWSMPAFALGCLASTFLIFGHNGERGRPMKYFFYAFYPLHLAILAGLAIIFRL
ncbi:MAG: conjugal transfer protein TraX [Treponema sp.]|nr:conjugal transfer protein TraX [Treponema sp.]